MHKSLKKSLLITFVALILIIVVAKIGIINNKKIKTELALCDSISDSVDATGFFVRHETEIINSSNGVYNFISNDGEKIKKGGIIAEIYEDENSALIQKKLEKLNFELQMLENFSKISNTISTNPNHIEKQMYQNLKGLSDAVNTASFEKLHKCKEQTLYSLNARQAILGKPGDFTEKIQKVQEQISNLKGSSEKKAGNIIASESGYFVGNVDGYENAADYKNIKSISCDKVKKLLNEEPAKTNAMAKIVNNSQWYVVCCIKSDDAFKIKGGAFVEIELPFTSLEKIPAQVVAINQENQKSEASIVLRCNYIKKDLLALRKEDIRINLLTYNGIRIDKKAIHEKLMTKKGLDENNNEVTVEKNVLGVYILDGNKLAFKEVKLNYIGANYAICEKEPDKSSLFSGDCLHVYDEVVVGGTDLYDGKTVK